MPIIIDEYKNQFKTPFRTGEYVWPSFERALQYATNMFETTGRVIGIERI